MNAGARELRTSALANTDFGTALSFLGQEIHKRAVAVLAPSQQYGWPCVSGFEGRVFLTAADNLVIVLKHRSGGPPCVDGKVHEADSLEAAGEDDGHHHARRALSVADSDVLLKAPLRLVSSDGIALWRAWSDEDWKRIHLHASLTVEHNRRHLGLPASNVRPPLNEADVFIAELVFREGPLTAKAIVAKLPRGRRMSEANVRRIFSEKLTPHYGFRNPRNRMGYHAPRERTWDPADVASM